MPIGKNAIKRVKNNGYSNVATSAPDMENSVVEEPVVKAPELLVETVAAQEEKPAKARRGRRPKTEATEKISELPAESLETAKEEKTVKAKRGRKPRETTKEVAVAENTEKTPAKKQTAGQVKESSAAPKKRGRKPRAAADKEGEKAPVKASSKNVRKEKDGFQRVEFGEEMPYWLL